MRYHATNPGQPGMYSRPIRRAGSLLAPWGKHVNRLDATPLLLAAEILVFCQSAKADQFWRIERLAVDFADALHADEAISAIIFEDSFDAWIDCQFFAVKY